MAGLTWRRRGEGTKIREKIIQAKIAFTNLGLNMLDFNFHGLNITTLETSAFGKTGLRIHRKLIYKLAMFNFYFCKMSY